MRSDLPGIQIAIVLGCGLLLAACAGSPPSGPLVGGPTSVEHLGPPNPDATVQPKAPASPRAATGSQHRRRTKTAAKARHPKHANTAERQPRKRDAAPEVIPLD